MPWAAEECVREISLQLACRTEKLEVQGGGNSGNQATAAARLGLSPHLITKIGDDGLGQGILAELARDGVGTEFVLRAQGSPSPFTYIIVDRQGGTRTCIHTPGAPMLPSEMTPELLDRALEGARLAWFDGRLTEAALVVAREARRRGIPVLVEAERLRPGLDALLAEADYVCTSAHFPQDWTGEPLLGDAILETLARLPRARALVTTRGTHGSVLLERCRDACPEATDAVLEDLLAGWLEDARVARDRGEVTACTTASGLQVKLGSVITASSPQRLRRKAQKAADAVAANARVS